MNLAASIILILAILALLRQLCVRAPRPALAERSDDEDVLATLEIHALSSPLAKRLLLAAKEPTAPKIEEWSHSTNVKTPSVEHWKLFLRNMAFETDDLGRSACLDQWLKMDNKFTAYEYVGIMALFDTVEGRHAARAAFVAAYQKKNVKP